MDLSALLLDLEHYIRKFGSMKKKHGLSKDGTFLMLLSMSSEFMLITVTAVELVLSTFLGWIIIDESTILGTLDRVQAVKRACSATTITDDDRILAEAIAQAKPAVEVLPLLNSFFDRWAPIRQPEPRDNSFRSDDDDVPSAKGDPIAQSLYRAWESQYFGSPLHDLRLFVDKYNRMDEKYIYGKTVVFVQSSGMGKSRLAHEYGRTVCPMIGFCLRRESE
jgi:hypothetical protein